MVLAKEAKDDGILAENSGVDPVLVTGEKLACAKVGGDHRGQTLIDSRVEKVVKAGYGKLIRKLGAEVVKDKKLALKVLFAP